MFNREFWLAAFERAVKTFVQAFIAVFGVASITDADALKAAGLSALTAAALSLLTSVASAGVGGAGPSLGPEELSGRHAAP